ncbi:hypothetical protein [Bradyrhizobium sp. PRIMUS42]|uniref:hypothetical protein n=1 Tax=Bradyrhizobium sp. PRIMUS42 TaxID=2908926 RepID=UPI001FF4FB15|nr:hypothetical protein [Bradyrhizobium sp. PRIMUS42]MCJ9728674.1 hypothetical protein [Bradyrhizobium sp. PRIMUS42]
MPIRFVRVATIKGWLKTEFGEINMTVGTQWQAPGLNRRRVGDYIVTAIVDGVVDVPFDLLAGISPGDAESMTVSSGRPR